METEISKKEWVAELTDEEKVELQKLLDKPQTSQIIYHPSETEILQRLYENGIGITITACAGEGIEIAWEMTNHDWAIIVASDYEKGLKQLALKCIWHYPDSDFAKWWRENGN